MYQAQIRNLNSQIGAAQRDRLSAALMFIYGAGWAFSFNIVGAIYGGELVALLLLPFLAPLTALRKNSALRRSLFAYTVILLGLVVADVHNSSASNDAFRGWATIVFASVNLWFSVCVLRKDPISGVLYFLAASAFVNLAFGNAGYKVTGVGSDLSFANIADDANAFKVVVVPFLLPLLAIVLHLLFRRRRHLGLMLGLVASALLFFFDARSAGIVIFAATLAGAFFERIRAMRPQMVLASVVAAIALSYMAYVAYVQYSLSGDLSGHNAHQLSLSENPYNPLSLLAVGRSEWLVAGTAISERPLFGYGSWPLDEGNNISYLRANLVGSEQVFLHVEQNNQFYIPTHSVLIASWVWGGLLGFVGAILLLVSFLRLASTTLVTRPDARILIAYFATIVLWDFFFSPIASLRLTFPVAIGFLIAIQNKPLRRRRRA
jgi:hypothetical protein